MVNLRQLPRPLLQESFFGYIVDKADNADNFARIVTDRLLQDFQILQSVVNITLYDIAAALAGAEDFLVLLGGKAGILLVLADFEVGLAINVKAVAVVAVYLVPVMGGKNILQVQIFEKNTGGYSLDNVQNSIKIKPLL